MLLMLLLYFLFCYPKDDEKCTVLQKHAADTELRFEFLILATAHCALPPEPHASPPPSSLYQIVLTNYSHSTSTQTLKQQYFQLLRCQITPLPRLPGGNSV